jgi:hypothetical protein
LAKLKNATTAFFNRLLAATSANMALRQRDWNSSKGAPTSRSKRSTGAISEAAGLR